MWALGGMRGFAGFVGLDQRDGVCDVYIIFLSISEPSLFFSFVVPSQKNSLFFFSLLLSYNLSCGLVPRSKKW